MKILKAEHVSGGSTTLRGMAVGTHGRRYRWFVYRSGRIDADREDLSCPGSWYRLGSPTPKPAALVKAIRAVVSEGAPEMA
jgi:hypothetical protein